MVKFQKELINNKFGTFLATPFNCFNFFDMLDCNRTEEIESEVCGQNNRGGYPARH